MTTTANTHFSPADVTATAACWMRPVAYQLIAGSALALRCMC